MTDALTQRNTRSENAAAFNVRAQFNNQRGSFDLGSWLHERIGIGPDARLLDVGCGTGSLLSRYGESALRHGRCVAIDVSPDRLVELRRTVEAAGYDKLETVCIDMDSLAEDEAHPELRGFTHIVSAHVLYYSADAEHMLHGLRVRLHPSGSLWFVGPAPGNNDAWFDLLAQAGVRIPAEIHAVSTFLERVAFPFALRCFESVQVELATNTVRFESPEKIGLYWRSNIYFDATASDAVRARAAEICRDRGALTNHKRIGLVAMRGRTDA